MVTQGCWVNESSFINLPGIDENGIEKLKNLGVIHLCQLIDIYNGSGIKELFKIAKINISGDKMNRLNSVLKKIPDIHFDVKLHRFDSDEMKPDYEAVGKSLRIEDEIYVSVNGIRLNHHFPLKVEMKSYVKPKDCSWWIIVGDEEKNVVYTVKKLFIKKFIRKEFQLTIPPIGERSSKISIYLINDSYFGLDQVITYDLEEYKTPVKGYKPPKFDRRQRKDQSKTQNEKKSSSPNKKGGRKRNKNKKGRGNKGKGGKKTE